MNPREIIDDEEVLHALEALDRANVTLRNTCIRLYTLLRDRESRILAHDGSVVGIIGPRPTDDPPSRPA